MITTLIVVLAGMLPTYIIRFSLLGVPTNLFETGVVAVFIVAIWNKESRYRLVGALRGLPHTFRLFACVFLLAAVVSTLCSPVLRSSLGILKGWIVVPMLFGLLIYTARNSVVMPDLIRHPRGSRVVARDDAESSASKHIMRSLIMSGLVVALLGISQIDGFGRIQSIYDVPNSLALFLVPIFISSVWLGIQEKNRFYQLSSVVMLAAIIWSQSFGALVAIVGTVLIGFLFTVRFPSPQLGRGLLARRREGEGRLGGMLDGLPSSVIRFAHVTFSPIGEKGYYYTLLFMLCILTLTFFTLSGRFQYLISPLIHQNTSNSATVRLQLWDIGVRLIQKHPILGIGLGQFEPAYQAELHGLFAAQANEASEANAARSYRLQPEFLFRDPHNWILSFWLNVGFLGLVSFTCLNVVALSFRPGSRNPGDVDAGSEPGMTTSSIYRQAATLALISILIFGLFDTIYWKNDLSALWWLLVISLL